jgi:hypothetical protein
MVVGLAITIVHEILNLTARRFNLVGVCVAVPCFLPVPVGGRVPNGHDETVLTVPSPGDGYEFWVTMK